MATAFERTLRAFYPGHKRLPNEAEFARYAQDLAARVFPASPLPIDVVLLRSRVRSFQNFDSPHRVSIVADQGLSDLLPMLDLLTLMQNHEPDHCLAVMQVPFAEAFRYEGALEHALLCAEMARQAKAGLRAVQQAAAARPGHSMHAVFLLFHELAHIHVDRRADFTRWVWAEAKEGLDAHCHFNRETSARIRSGDRLADLNISFADEPARIRNNMAGQMDALVAHVLSDNETVRETSCDVVAALAFLAMRAGPAAFEHGTPRIMNVSMREVGDALLLGLRASRYLMALAFLQQYAGHIARKSDPSSLGMAMAKLTARSNVTTNMARTRFKTIIAGWPAENPHPLPPLPAEEIARLFDQSVQQLAHRSTDRLLSAIEQIGLYHRDRSKYGEDIRDLKTRLFATTRPAAQRIKLALEKRLAQLPF